MFISREMRVIYIKILIILLVILSITGCDLERKMEELTVETPSQGFDAIHGTQYNWKITAAANKRYELILTLKSNIQYAEPSLSVNGEGPCADCKTYVAEELPKKKNIVVSFMTPENGVVYAGLFWSGDNATCSIELREAVFQ